MSRTKEDEDDDYLTMSFEDPSTQHESSLQRKQRLRREAEIRSRPKSKRELEAEQETARETALSTGISSSNKGFKMMAKLGYKPGTALGAPGSNAATEPIRPVMKENKGGIGLDSDRKRKLKEAAESVAKKAKEDVNDFVDRVRSGHTEKKREAQVLAAQRITEKLDTEMYEAKNPGKKPLLRSLNVLWRGIYKERLLKEQERRVRHDLLQSSSRLPHFEDPDEDNEDRQALGKDAVVVIDEGLDEEDEEIDEFNALPSEERLEKLVLYLRETYNYCFWCKHAYPDSEMDGCPGLTEDDHD